MLDSSEGVTRRRRRNSERRALRSPVAYWWTGRLRAGCQLSDITGLLARADYSGTRTGWWFDWCTVQALYADFLTDRGLDTHDMSRLRFVNRFAVLTGLNTSNRKLHVGEYRPRDQVLRFRSLEDHREHFERLRRRNFPNDYQRSKHDQGSNT